MTRFLKILGMLAIVAAVLGIAAYAYGATRSEAKMLGVVVAASNAALEVSDQPGAGSVLEIDRTLAPDASWVVVHLDMDGKPGKRVGLAHVDVGESRDVRVDLDPGIELTDKLLVALHADRGITGKFEFAMDRFDTSPDKPYFVNGMELATAVTVK